MRPLDHRGFRLFAADSISAEAAAAIVDRALAVPGDRLQFVIPSDRLPGGRPGKVFVKVEFLRPTDALAKRMRASRARCEAAGYEAFQANALDVPELLLWGEQSRLRPRAGALVATAKVDAENGSAALQSGPRVDIAERIAAALGAVHARGFVHGDAAIRNFLPAEDRVWVIDLPRWAPWTAEAAEADLSQLLGSAMKAGAPEEWTTRLLGAYRRSCGSAGATLLEGWESRVLAAAAAYNTHLVSRDQTRTARHERRRRSILRSKPRTA